MYHHVAATAAVLRRHKSAAASSKKYLAEEREGGSGAFMPRSSVVGVTAARSESPLTAALRNKKAASPALPTSTGDRHHHHHSHTAAHHRDHESKSRQENTKTNSGQGSHHSHGHSRHCSDANPQHTAPVFESDLASRFTAQLLARKTRPASSVQASDPSDITATLLAAFDASAPPCIPLLVYTQRLLKYGATEESLVLSLMYIDNLLRDYPDFILGDLNIHRLLLACVVVSLKHWEDVFYSNEFYSRVGGVTGLEMNDLEIAVLCLLKFNLFVSPQSYDLYKDSLAAPLRGSTHFKTSRTKIIPPESSPLPPPSNDEIPPPPIETAPASPITTPNNSNSINITNQFQFTVFTHPTGTSPNTNSSTSGSNANSASATPTQTELSISSLTCCVGAALQSATRLSPSPSKVAPTKPQLSYHKGPQWLSPYSSKSKRNKSPPSPNSNDS